MIDPSPGADLLRKYGAMIRREFSVDPWTLKDDEFSRLSQEVLWLSKFDKEQMEEAIANVCMKLFSR